MKEEEIAVRVENLALRGRAYWPGDVCRLEKNKPLLVLCHGIPRAEAAAEKTATDGEDGGYPALARQCVKLGIPVSHFNFRGTGQSEGNFDLQGWMRDLTAFLNYWEERGAGSFILWGFSAAAVSACVAANEQRVRHVILSACPSSFRELFPVKAWSSLLIVFARPG